MGVLQRRAEFGNQGQRLRRAEARGLHRLAQVDAVDVFHRQPEVAAAFAEIMDRHDVRMAEFRQGPRLPREALREPGIVLQPGQQDLQGNQPVELRLARLVNNPHPAATDAFEDLELRQGGTDVIHRWQVRRHGVLAGTEQHADRTQAAGGIRRQRATTGRAKLFSHIRS